MLQIIQAIVNLLKDPMAIKVLIAIVVTVLLYFMFSAAVGAMAMPDATSSKRYRFWFRFLNRLAGNLDRAAKALHVPGAEDPQDAGTGKGAGA
jgi:ABC-type uncharacterized transport system permease subunit